MKKAYIGLSRAASIKYKQSVDKLEVFDMSKIPIDSKEILVHWRRYDVYACLMSTLGLILSIIDYEISFSSKRTYENCLHGSNNICRYLTLIFTIIATFFICLRYLIQRKFYVLQSKNLYKEHYKHLFQHRTILHLSLFLEISLLWIFPYPTLESTFHILESSRLLNPHGHEIQYSVCYTYSELFLVIMCARFYFIIKCLLNNSSYRDIFANYFCNKYNTRAGFRFSIKSLLANKQWLLIIVVIAPSILILAEILRIFERPYEDISELNFDAFLNALWCLITTISTIGYGDFFPSTYGGRVICLLSTLWGGFSLSWVILVLSSWIYLSPEEELALIKIIKKKKNYYENEDEEFDDNLEMQVTPAISEFISNEEKKDQPKGKKIFKHIVLSILRIEGKMNKLIRLRANLRSNIR